VNRPYVPELRSIPLTWMDCDARYPNENGYDTEACTETFFTKKCEDAVKKGICPRGFQ
jgi:hypothetical protein